MVSSVSILSIFLLFVSGWAPGVSFQPGFSKTGKSEKIQLVRKFSTKQGTVLDKPDWAGGGLASDMVNFLIGIKPLFKVMRVGARNLLIQNAEKKGIAWQEDADFILGKQKELEKICADIRDETLVYPDYYLQEFHGYDEGNLNWLAAAECRSATRSMATRVWPTEDFTYQQFQSKLRSSYLDPLVEYMEEVGASNAPQNVLDIGCSVGVSTSALQEYFPRAEVMGLDLSPYFLAVAKYFEQQEGASENPITWKHAKAESTGLPSDSVDVAMLTFVLHECPSDDTAKILEEVYRVVKPGGVIAITDIDPKSEVIQKLPRAVSTLMKSTEPWSDQYYTLDMQETIQCAGFKQFRYVASDPRHCTYYAMKEGVTIEKKDWSDDLKTQFLSFFSS